MSEILMCPQQHTGPMTSGSRAFVIILGVVLLLMATPLIWVTKSRLWVRYIGDLWPKLAGIFKVIPDATQECPAELLNVIATGMVEVARALLGQVGFTLIDGDGEDTAVFLITRRDFPR